MKFITDAKTDPQLEATVNTIKDLKDTYYAERKWLKAREEHSIKKTNEALDIHIKALETRLLELNILHEPLKSTEQILINEHSQLILQSETPCNCPACLEMRGQQ